MTAEQTTEMINARVEAGLGFVETLARRMASTMPHSVDLDDLVQDGVLGLIDAARRFEESRGIKFETFAERRVRGAMIDALRRDAWPRGVRRARREIEAARETLRRRLGHEPSVAELAAEVGMPEARLSRMIVRINTIEQTSPLSCAEHIDESQLPAALVPMEPQRPDTMFERDEDNSRIRQAVESLPEREQRVIVLYYYGEVTMKEIGAELGVNESRVSQLHARALGRLREALGPVQDAARSVAMLRKAVLAFAHKPVMARATLRTQDAAVAVPQGPAVVLDYASASRAARSRSASRKGLSSQRQPVSSRNRSASVPATSPVTKITRRASAGAVAAMAR